MATYTLTAGDRAAHEKTLVATTADTVTFVGFVNRVQIVNHDGADQIYVTVDGTTPVAKAATTYCLPAAISSLEIPVPDSKASGVSVKLVSEGTPLYSVVRLDEKS
jgi:hypothetical protein